MRQIVTVTGCHELIKKRDCHKKFCLLAVLGVNFRILNPNFFPSRPILPPELMNLGVHGVTRHHPIELVVENGTVQPVVNSEAIRGRECITRRKQTHLEDYCIKYKDVAYQGTPPVCEHLEGSLLVIIGDPLLLIGDKRSHRELV